MNDNQRITLNNMSSDTELLPHDIHIGALVFREGLQWRILIQQAEKWQREAATIADTKKQLSEIEQKVVLILESLTRIYGEMEKGETK